MKYVWEACDIKPGRRVDTHNRGEESIIGYDPRLLTNEPERYALTSMDDGQLTYRGTLVEMVSWLNKSGHRPKTIWPDDISA